MAKTKKITTTQQSNPSRTRRGQGTGRSLSTTPAQWKTQLNITQNKVWQEFDTDCREAYEDHIAGLFLVDPSTPAFETMTELQDAKEEMISKWESKPLYRSNNKQNFEAAVASCCWQYLKDDRDDNIRRRREEEAAEAKAKKDAVAFGKGRPVTEGLVSPDTEDDEAQEFWLNELTNGSNEVAKDALGEWHTDKDRPYVSDPGESGDEITVNQESGSESGEDEDEDVETASENCLSAEATEESDEDENEGSTDKPEAETIQKPSLGAASRDREKEWERLRKRFNEQREYNVNLEKSNKRLREEVDDLRKAHKRFKNAIIEDKATIRGGLRLLQQDLDRELEYWISLTDEGSPAPDATPERSVHNTRGTTNLGRRRPNMPLYDPGPVSGFSRPRDSGRQRPGLPLYDPEAMPDPARPRPGGNAA